MAETTNIEWCDATWSPWEGCTKVSVGPQGGCVNCYAEGMNRWLHKGENWGPGAPRRIYSEDHWDKPIKWQRAALKFETLHHRRRRVFPSVCDPFDNEAPGLQRERLWATIRLTPALDWLLLTKRIGNAKAMLPSDWGDGYPNVWLGATVVTQEEADRDIPKLLGTPARVRFLSCEPLLGPICIEQATDLAAGGTIDWVIAGGESGPHARPAHPDWFRDLRDECEAFGTPFLFKQWGEWSPGRQAPHISNAQAAKHPFVELEHEGCTVGAFKCGKKAAGRLLDGVTHDGFPEA